MLLSFTKSIIPLDHVVPTTWPPRVQIARDTNCVVAGIHRANTGTTLANVSVAFGAGDERGGIFPNPLPGQQLSKEACGRHSFLPSPSLVVESPHRFHISTASTATKLAGSRNVPPVVVTPEVSRVPVTLVLGMFAYIEAAGNNLGTCRNTKKQFLVGRVPSQ